MRCVTMKPADDVDGGDEHRAAPEQGDRRERIGPDSCSMPPITMMPLIALVTLISGVCSAGVTFQITCQPMKHASTNTVRCARKLWGATMPSPSSARRQHPRTITGAGARRLLLLLLPARSCCGRRWRRARASGRAPARPSAGWRPHQLAVRAARARRARPRRRDRRAKCARAAHVGEQVVEVVAVELARRRREAARQIHVADDGDAVLRGPPRRAWSARSCRRSPPRGRRSPSRASSRHHLLGDEMRRRALPGMSAVVMMMSTSLALRGEHLHLGLDERRAHLFRVAALARSRPP